MKKGDILELNIESYAFEGKGVAKLDIEDSNNEGEKKKFVVFAHGAYPGDKVKARIVKKKKSYAEAKVTEILEKAPLRIEPKCKYFGVCGGCKQQDLEYDIQLKYKHEQVKDIFERIGGLSDFEYEDIEGSEKIFHYRNKMEYSFARKRWLSPEEINQSDEIRNQQFAVGLHIPRIFDKVLDLDECFLQSEASNKILNFTREFFKSRETSIYSCKTHEGYLRNLVIKSAHHTNDLMVNLVTSSDDEKLFKEYSDALVEEIPEITTVINNVNLKKAMVAFGDFEKVYHGEGCIYDSIGGYRFRISANSFFQTNTLQAEKLYRTALDYGEITKDDVVYDLYSGAGTISIYVSERAKEVHAFESVEDAVKDAHVNAGINGIENVKFYLADLNKSMKDFLATSNLPKPDVVIADPPRSGMNPKTIRDILRMQPKKVVYVSCNPATQARDIEMLTEQDYKLVKVKPVDMFPHTYHIENVALLVRK